MDSQQINCLRDDLHYLAWEELGKKSKHCQSKENNDKQTPRLPDCGGSRLKARPGLHALVYMLWSTC